MTKFIRKAAFVLAATGMVMATPSQAAGYGNAEKLRRLDIMLMVTGLRCRNGASNFQADFQDFEAAHLDTLNSAAEELRSGLVPGSGKSADRALDRISTAMANEYGAGHPWLECSELKMVAQSLARMKGDVALLEAADQLLSSSGSPNQLTWARR